jgi:lactoylglutathione lyase
VQARINLITLVTSDLAGMTSFYRDVLGFEILSGDGENFVEFKNEGVRFALTTRTVMQGVTDDASYQVAPVGQRVELAIAFDSNDEVDQAYAEITAKGARTVQPPATMPWGQYTAFFADPDGNIHELFTG